MDLIVKLTVEEWNFILEVLNLNQTNQIKATAINMLKSQLEREFESLNKK